MKNFEEEKNFKLYIKDGSIILEHKMGELSQYFEMLFANSISNIDSPEHANSLLSALSSSVMKNFDEKNKTAFFNFIKKLSLGFEIANRCMVMDEGVHYFVKSMHIGDTSRTLKLISLFKNYHLQNETMPIKKIVVITTKSLASLATLYPDIDEFIILDKRELGCLFTFLQSCKTGMSSSYNYYLDVDYWITPKLKAEYKLPCDAIPHQQEILRFPSKMTNQAVLSAKDILARYNAEASKTVVLFPYSYTTSSILNWKGTVEYFNSIGYTVFTNAGSDKEKELDGTFRLDALPAVVLALGYLGCLMFGVQSGFMDTIHWLRMSIKCITVFILKTSRDREFVNWRKLTQDITYREDTMYLVLDADEENTFSEKAIQQSKFYIKGNLIREYYLDLNVPAYSMYSCDNLNDYISEVLKLEHTVIFLSVCDSANKYWDKFTNKMLLNLKEDLSKVWRLSYIAIIDKDNDVCVEQLSDKWDGIDFQYFFPDVASSKSDALVYGSEVEKQYGTMPEENICWVYSCAMDCLRYTKSSIVINGTDYSLNKRGLNIVIYSKTLAQVIDSINVDTFGDPALMVRRQKDFENSTER